MVGCIPSFDTHKDLAPSLTYKKQFSKFIWYSPTLVVLRFNKKVFINCCW